MNVRLDDGRGNVADYLLGTVTGWETLEVVRFHAVEELSRPFEWDVTLRRKMEDGPVDLDGLLDTGATFRMATAKRWRTVHGVVAEAEELDRTRQFFYYRVLLVPPLWRMRYRTRCRTFVYRTLKEVLTCVLENRAFPGAPPIAGLLPLSGEIEADDPGHGGASFEEPHGRYVWRVSDERRLVNRDLHPFVVQYNESDFDFLSRWLAHEGLSYYFEHTATSVVMVVTDSPGHEAPHPTDREAMVRGGVVAGAAQDQQVVRWLRDVRRMRPRSVTMREYDYRRSAQVFDSQVAAGGASAEAFGHFEFPAKDDRLAEKLGAFPATRNLERFEVERHLRHGMSTLRILAPGHAITLKDGDGTREDEEFTLVRSETFATQHALSGSLLEKEPFGFHAEPQELGGFENRFEVLARNLPFRTAYKRDREKIWGVQVGRVWGPDTTVTVDGSDKNLKRSEPVDVHCDAFGRIRVRFPWDQRNLGDGEPASDWCRVAQPWAGSAYGASHIPRVGHEVLVAFENGDPDRPVVVGSVHTHPETPPPYDTSDAKNKTRTTLKTKSSGVAEAGQGSNELRFTDYTNEEEIYLHAERDLNEVVKHNHSTSVGGDQSNSVGGNQSNSVAHNRTHDVTGTECVHVHGDRTTTFDANEGHSVGANRSTTLGAVDRLEVGSSRVVLVHGPDMAIVDGDDATQVGGERTVQVAGNHVAETDASYHSTASGNHRFNSTNMYVTQAGEVVIKAGGATLHMTTGYISIDNGAGASVLLSGSLASVSASTVVVMGSGAIHQASGGPINLVGGGDINATAPAIHLNG